MNNPNPSPLIPQGSIPPVRGKSNVRIAVFTIIAIHAVLCFGLLMQGCKRDGDKATNKTTDNIAVLPPIDTNYYNATDAVSTLSPSATPAPTQPASSNPAPAGNPSPVTQPGQVNPAPAQPAALPPVEPPTTPVPADAKEYTVVRGDSFYKIGKAHGVSISTIAKANPNVDPVKLNPGKKLMIPAPTPS
ncbi:MAG: LysM domain-containing protein, partial [Verrucomicrobiota bacterium]